MSGVAKRVMLPDMGAAGVAGVLYGVPAAVGVGVWCVAGIPSPGCPPMAPQVADEAESAVACEAVVSPV